MSITTDGSLHPGGAVSGVASQDMEQWGFPCGHVRLAPSIPCTSVRHEAMGLPLVVACTSCPAFRGNLNDHEALGFLTIPAARLHIS